MATVQKWGNSLAIRVPKELARKLQVSEGSPVDLELREGELVVRPAPRRSLSLKKLLTQCKPSQLHGETDFGPNVGREVVE
jgi:antitoxin MazE